MIYEFDVFRIDDINRVLTREGEELALQSRAFDCLLQLVRHAGKLILKAEMMDAVWTNSFVEESSLTVAVSTIRRTLGEEHGERRFIQTVSGRGYRFICEVRMVAAASGASATAQPVSTLDPATPAIASSLPAPRAASPALISARSARWLRSKTLLWSLAIAALLVAVVLGWALWRGAFSGSGISSLAILPFHSEKQSDQDDALLLTTVDKLITDLGQTVSIRQMSSVLQYSSPTVDPAAVGRLEKVDAVVTGRMTRSRDSLTMRVTMIRSANGQILWQQDFSAPEGEMDRMRKEIENGLREQLPHTLRRAAPPTPPTEARPTNEEAYQSYLRGRYLWGRRTDKSLRKHIKYFKQSIQLDPNYAMAYAGLADSYAIQASFSVRPGISCGPDARAAALGALALNPQLAQPHAALGMASFFADWDTLAAEKEFQKAIALDPNYATSHHWYALDLTAMGRLPQALYEIHRAQELEPLSLMIGTNAGWVLYIGRDYAKAIQAYEKVIELDPSFVRARTRLGIVQMQTGDLSGAIRNLEAAAENSPDDPYIMGLLGQAQAMAGQRGAAELKLGKLKKLAATQYVPPISLALIYQASPGRAGFGRAARGLQGPLHRHGLRQSRPGIRPAAPESALPADDCHHAFLGVMFAPDDGMPRFAGAWSTSACASSTVSGWRGSSK